MKPSAASSSVATARPAGGATLVARSVTTTHHTSVEVDIAVDGQPFWNRRWLYGEGIA